jgi:hypothetical protein
MVVWRRLVVSLWQRMKMWWLIGMIFFFWKRIDRNRIETEAN